MSFYADRQFLKIFQRYLWFTLRKMDIEQYLLYKVDLTAKHRRKRMKIANL